ncbi:MAG: hypothetical protein GOU97_03820 [Nanoarchaeota archaeon]|nr:hypothetical protein [Nanoarchaeota archaeon]
MSIDDIIISKKLVLEIQDRFILDYNFDRDEEGNISSSETNRIRSITEDLISMLENAYRKYAEEIEQFSPGYEEADRKKTFFTYLLNLSAIWDGKKLDEVVYNHAIFEINSM